MISKPINFHLNEHACLHKSLKPSAHGALFARGFGSSPPHGACAWAPSPECASPRPRRGLLGGRQHHPCQHGRRQHQARRHRAALECQPRRAGAGQRHRRPPRSELRRLRRDARRGLAGKRRHVCRGLAGVGCRERVGGLTLLIERSGRNWVVKSRGYILGARFRCVSDARTVSPLQHFHSSFAKR